MPPCALVMPLSLMTVMNGIYPESVVGSISGIIAFGSGLGGTLFLSVDFHCDGLSAPAGLEVLHFT